MKLSLNKNGDFDLTGMSSAQISAIKNALHPSVEGYNYIKDMSFAQRKELYRQNYGEITEGNSELKKTFQLQLEFGKVCAEILAVIDSKEGSAAKGPQRGQ